MLRRWDQLQRGHQGEHREDDLLDLQVRPFQGTLEDTFLYERKRKEGDREERKIALMIYSLIYLRFIKLHHRPELIWTIIITVIIIFIASSLGSGRHTFRTHGTTRGHWHHTWGRHTHHTRTHHSWRGHTWHHSCNNFRMAIFTLIQCTSLHGEWGWQHASSCCGEGEVC